MTLGEAEISGGPYVLMLAAVICHELAHVDGCDEAQARERETALWQEFVKSSRVDSSIGLTYLAELRVGSDCSMERTRGRAAFKSFEDVREADASGVVSLHL